MLGASEDKKPDRRLLEMAEGNWCELMLSVFIIGARNLGGLSLYIGHSQIIN